ncbi:thiamine phosphate synthase [Aliarcobacter butzleri]|uniref:thiamine phosphate synthase n=1 Tax=Aliarcobacter butzleri TaxID=28197 RepID=UPI00125EA8DB|nr:thiamine phosphate synthase [Aliarcobacter butzleri]MCT7561398.1 thiamine phosphate synthase [Aliarcobacter butzleri]MCT7628303.1 thiamine phosphate synthase [Aliarcobacter butzleri]
MKKYLITDPNYYTNDEITFKQTLSNAFEKHKVDFACFRDKQSNNFEALAKTFIETCCEKNIENIYLNSNILLAKKLGFNGVHLTSTQFEDIKKAKELNLKIIISCHNIKDIETARKYEADYITYSPIFDTPNKGEAKGIKDLELILNRFKDMKIIALGGIIDENQVSKIEKTKAYGFASIRYFI